MGKHEEIYQRNKCLKNTDAISIMKKYISIIIIFSFLLYLPIHTESNTIIVHEEQSIQDAINKANSGDKIIIEGVFHESILVNKSIFIEGRNAIIYGVNGSVINITAMNVILKNIKIRNSDATHGIIEVRGKAIIKDCNISYGRYGIISEGISIIINCTINECGGGVLIKNDSVVSSCHIYKCGIGIECYGSHNIINGSKIHTCGVALYMQNASGNIIEKCNLYKNNNNEADIFMLFSNNNTIRNCDISYVSFAIRMMNCTYNYICDSKIHDARYGIKYENCKHCHVCYSIFYRNRFGIEIDRCKDMKFNYNDFENKMYNLYAKFSYCDARHNYWNGIIPRKIKNEASIVLKIPWLIKPINGEEIEIMKKENKHFPHHLYNHHSFNNISIDGFDPLVDIKTIFIVKRVRSMDMGKYEIKIRIDGKESSTYFKGDTFPKWKAIQDVDDSKQIVEISILIGNELKNLHYDLATGNWYGDDYLGDYNDLCKIYWKYFLDGNTSNKKHSLFHYEIIGKYSSMPRGGHAFVGWDNLDSFMLGGEYINEWRVGKARRIAYASLSMHELGHTLGLFEYTFAGIDNESCNAPWMRGYWIYRNYKSCLNYRYAFSLVDYSNGKHGRNDFDDWDNIDLTFFKNSYYYP